MHQPFSRKTIQRRLKCWVDAKLMDYEDRNKSLAPDCGPDVPHLPNPRLYTLTPPSSVQDFKLPPQDSPFLKKLPSDIRNKVLVLAFGDRTVHMDLFFDHPFGPPHPWQYAERGDAHGGSQTPFVASVDYSKPKHWQWRGCVCHRTRAPLFRRYDDRHTGYTDEPGGDQCLTGEVTRCDEWSMTVSQGNPKKLGPWKKKPELCLIGALGWLLACRQAYAEGVQVLYGTNTIHLSSKPLLCNISTLVLPQRLLSVSSLEIAWTINTRQHLGKAYPRLDELNQILSILDTSFPHLRSLYLGINVERPTKAFVDFGDMMKNIDSFVSSRTKRLTEPVEVSITSTAYNEWYEAIFTVEQKEKYGSSIRCQYWRFLSGENALAAYGSSAKSWAKVEGATKHNGYWVVRGDKDDDRAAQVEMNRTAYCFGSSAGL